MFAASRPLVRMGPTARTAGWKCCRP